MTTFREGGQKLGVGFKQAWNRYQTQAGWRQITLTLAFLFGGLAIAVILFRAFSPTVGVTEAVSLVDIGMQPEAPEETEPEPAPMAPVEPEICTEQREAERRLEEFMEASDIAKKEVARLILEIASSRGPARKDWSNIQALESEAEDTGLDQLLADFSGTASSFHERLEDGSLRTDANTSRAALEELFLMLEYLEGTEAYLKDNSGGRMDFVIADDAFTRVDTAYRKAKAFENRRQFDLATMEQGGACNDSIETTGLD